MSGLQDEIPPPPPPQETQQTPTQQTLQTVSTIKLPILKKGEYDIWAMKIEHYLASSKSQAIDHSTGGKLHDKSAKESLELIENLALYDHESWNYPRDLAKPVKAISLPHDVLSTSDRHLIELEN
ncbi:hypothetical protein Tco_0933431 [Tanacetum coccineum]